jgi:hypothetical protein
MEGICFSETSGETQWTTRRDIPEDDTLHNHRCENLKSYIGYLCFLMYPEGIAQSMAWFTPTFNLSTAASTDVSL